MPDPPKGFIEDKPDNNGLPPGFVIDDQPTTSEIEPGSMAATGRLARGIMTGVESTVAGVGQSLPQFLQGPNQDLAKKVLAGRPPPKDRIESLGGTIGEVLPAFAIPSLGLEGTAARALPNFPRISQFLGKTAEGAISGSAGGAMMPEGEKLKNTGVGAAAGATYGAAAGAYMALPPGLRRIANAAAGAAAAEGVKSLGITDWYMAAPIYWEIYHQRLLDLATQWLARKSAGVGAVGVKLKEGQEKQ